MRTRWVSRVRNRAMVRAVFGDLVGAAVRDAFDDLVGAEPAQVVADLAAGHVLWRFPELGAEMAVRWHARQRAGWVSWSGR